MVGDGPFDAGTSRGRGNRSPIEVNVIERVSQRSWRLATVAMVALALSACGDAPLGSLGERSSEWINEPEVTTTTLPQVTVPKWSGSDQLQWANDDLSVEIAEDPDAVVAAVFARREGDRFIQASRAEIAAAIPGIRFPAKVPYGAEWVSSQLVIDNNGQISTNPSAAFGIWSAEPYTRSRSVAQMAVLRVSVDPETADELAAEEAVTSCARFADVTTTGCDMNQVGDMTVWTLSSSSGTTLIWFNGDHRYELFGRSFVPRDVVEAMVVETTPLVGESA